MSDLSTVACAFRRSLIAPPEMNYISAIQLAVIGQYCNAIRFGWNGVPPCRFPLFDFGVAFLASYRFDFLVHQSPPFHTASKRTVNSDVRFAIVNMLSVFNTFVAAAWMIYAESDGAPGRFPSILYASRNRLNLDGGTMP